MTNQKFEIIFNFNYVRLNFNLSQPNYIRLKNFDLNCLKLLIITNMVIRCGECFQDILKFLGGAALCIICPLCFVIFLCFFWAKSQENENEANGNCNAGHEGANRQQYRQRRSRSQSINSNQVVLGCLPQQPQAMYCTTQNNVRRGSQGCGNPQVVITENDSQPNFIVAQQEPVNIFDLQIRHAQQLSMQDQYQEEFNQNRKRVSTKLSCNPHSSSNGIANQPNNFDYPSNIDDSIGFQKSKLKPAGQYNKDGTSKSRKSSMSKKHPPLEVDVKKSPKMYLFACIKNLIAVQYVLAR